MFSFDFVSLFKTKEKSLYGSKGNRADHPSSKMMILWYDILDFMNSEGKTIHDLWLRLKTLLLQCSTYGILDYVLLDSFYRGPILRTEKWLTNLLWVV